MNEDLPEQLRSHYQLENASCAVSGFESVAKLHGLIAPDAFPLQSDPTKQGMGFDDTSFLLSLCLLASDTHLARDIALDRIESETSDGKFPLVSLLTGQAGSTLYWHIFVCAQHGGDLLLIDPAYPKVQAQQRAGLAAEFQRTLDAIPDRQMIHLLTYVKTK
ncbi:hypothetical protein [Prosthecobacter sp.]|uniref:hypothetical protein n=1 Tax=Prosthecobacter sp. TaxID=1965333 RepID=UPI002ABB7B76|nr:hypothetical protein [Prosthecobacter sp.]MDZ4405231.1 hypothetical protein [Prosthecobacter sp.]